MPENSKENNSILSDYLFSSTSFSTFKFDKLSHLACKYYLTKFNFMKKKYLKDIYVIINNKQPKNDYDYNYEKYFASRTIKALMESNILFSEKWLEIKLCQKIKGKKDILVSDTFKVSDLPYDISTKNVCMFIYDSNDKLKYRDLIRKCTNIHFISLSDDSNKEKEDIIYDNIKQMILRDDSDIYFVADGIYSNYIVNSVYSVDKIGINL